MLAGWLSPNRSTATSLLRSGTPLCGCALSRRCRLQLRIDLLLLSCLDAPRPSLRLLLLKMEEPRRGSGCHEARMRIDD